VFNSATCVSRIQEHESRGAFEVVQIGQHFRIGIGAVARRFKMAMAF
jgi:hypothetical protein